MTASFPNLIKTFTTKTDGIDDVLAEHVNSLQDEVTAIETTLGTGTAGSSTNVMEKIAGLRSFAGATADVISITGSNVGIGAIPTAQLDVFNSGNNPEISIRSSSATPILSFISGGGILPVIGYTGDLRIGSVAGVGAASFSEKLRATSGGDFYSVALTDYSATSTIAGWSAYTVKKIYYKKIGKTIFVYWDIRGTGSGTASSFTLPFMSDANTGQFRSACYSMDNVTVTQGWGALSANSNQVLLDKDAAGNNWTNAVTRYSIGQLVYEAA